jgi:hypothetical protein
MQKNKQLYIAKPRKKIFSSENPKIEIKDNKKRVFQVFIKRRILNNYQIDCHVVQNLGTSLHWLMQFPTLQLQCSNNCSTY